MKLHKSNLARTSSAHFMNFPNDSERKLNKNQCGHTVYIGLSRMSSILSFLISERQLSPPKGYKRHRCSFDKSLHQRNNVHETMS